MPAAISIAVDKAADKPKLFTLAALRLTTITPSTFCECLKIKKRLTPHGLFFADDAPMTAGSSAIV